MISIGVVAVLLATIQHVQIMHKLRAQDTELPYSLAAAVALLVSILGILALVTVLSTIDLPKMAETNRADAEIFDGGPPFRLEKSLGLIKPNERRSVQRALLALLIVWAPLFVLSAIESLVLGENRPGSLIGDLTVLSRYLIVVPLFILVEDGTIFRLGQITRHLSMPEL